MRATRASILALLFAVGCMPNAGDCPAYCTNATDALPLADVQAQCIAAFGPGYTVVVRACPRGLVPNGCASLSEYNDSTVQCDPGDIQPDDVLCCAK